jgi:hypothetical protein
MAGTLSPSARSVNTGAREGGNLAGKRRAWLPVPRPRAGPGRLRGHRPRARTETQWLKEKLAGAHQVTKTGPSAAAVPRAPRALQASNRAPGWAPIFARLPLRRSTMGQVRVVVTRIERDGTMHRRMVDTAQQSDPKNWEGLAARTAPSPSPSPPGRRSMDLPVTSQKSGSDTLNFVGYTGWPQPPTSATSGPQSLPSATATPD